MGALKTRLDAIERRAASAGCSRWHCIIQEVGQTEAQARAAYEAENGPIQPGEGSIVRVIIE